MKRKFFIKNLLMFILPLLIPIVLLGGFSISITQGYVRNNIDKNNLKMLSQTEETIELIFGELDSLSLNFNYNANVSLSLKSILESNPVNYADLSKLDTITNVINIPVNSKPYIQSIYVYFANSNQNFFVSDHGFTNINDFTDKSWYESFISNNNENNTWIEVRNTKLYEFEKENTRLITIYKKLYSPGVNKSDGVIAMNIKSDYVENILKGLNIYPEQSVLVLDENSKVVIAGGDKSAYQHFDFSSLNSTSTNFSEVRILNKSYIISQIKSGRYPLKYLSIIPKQSLYKVPIQLIYLTVILLVLSLLLGIALAFYLTRKSYSHISNILLAFESVEKGHPLPELPSRVTDEYGFILQNIIKTFIEQSYLKVQLSEKKYKLKTMEMLALQSQINPHFLFNTLKTIFWKSLALTGNQNEVSKMIEYLSEILHYSLGNSEKTITLEEEIRNTQNYIEIQKIRYKDKFKVIWQYSDEVLNYHVIKLLFQPFIENCIYHGIKEKEGSSFIKIKIQHINSHIKISIIDNGLGIDKDTLAKIRERLKDEGEYSEHIGILNTYKRLMLNYDDECQIIIRSKFGLGTAISINIPTGEKTIFKNT